MEGGEQTVQCILFLRFSAFAFSLISSHQDCSFSSTLQSLLMHFDIYVYLDTLCIYVYHSWTWSCT